MAEMKNICGKIPLELHEKVRQEIEETESSTQKFIQQVIEEHFMRKGTVVSMEAIRTVAVQVSEELFGRLKAVVARKGCKQKDFLIGLIEQAIEAEEARWRAEATETGDAQEEAVEAQTDEDGPESEEVEAGDEEPETEETGAGDVEADTDDTDEEAETGDTSEDEDTEVEE